MSAELFLWPHSDHGLRAMPKNWGSLEVCSPASGLCTEFISVPPTQSLALSWGHGRDAMKACYGGRVVGRTRVLLLIFWFFLSGKALICFRGIKGQGSERFLEQVSWEKAAVASTGCDEPRR